MSEKIHTCLQCDYTSKWKHNVTRHTVAQHSTNEKGPSAQAGGYVSLNTNIKECSLCHRIFARRSIMLNHIKKCKGLSKLQCEYCHKIFAKRSGKYKHTLICKAKKEIDSKALTICPEQEVRPPQNATIQPVVAQSIVGDSNNVTTNVNNNSNNTTNTTILVFAPNTMFKYDHISKTAIRDMMHNIDCPAVLSAFSKELLKCDDNVCVKKTNIRSPISTVHVGNDVWETQPDSVVFPQMLSNVAYTMNDSIEKHKLDVHRLLEEFLEDVLCFGEHGNSRDKEGIARLKKTYKTLNDCLKAHLFNTTKQAKKAMKTVG